MCGKVVFIVGIMAVIEKIVLIILVLSESAGKLFQNKHLTTFNSRLQAALNMLGYCYSFYKI